MFLNLSDKTKGFLLGMAALTAWQDRSTLTAEFTQVSTCVMRHMGNHGSCSAEESASFKALAKSLAVDACGPFKPNCQAFINTGVR